MSLQMVVNCYMDARNGTQEQQALVTAELSLLPLPLVFSSDLRTESCKSPDSIREIGLEKRLWVSISSIYIIK